MEAPPVEQMRSVADRTKAAQDAMAEHFKEIREAAVEIEHGVASAAQEHPAIAHIRAIGDVTEAAESSVADIFQHTYVTLAAVHREAWADDFGAPVSDATLTVLDACTSILGERLLGLANEASDQIARACSAAQQPAAVRPESPTPTGSSLGCSGTTLALIGVATILDWLNVINLSAWGLAARHVLQAIRAHLGA